MNWLLLALLLVASVTFGGCEVIGGIFKAGFWTGAIAIVLILAVIGFAAMKMRT